MRDFLVAVLKTEDAGDFFFTDRTCLLRELLFAVDNGIEHLVQGVYFVSHDADSVEFLGLDASIDVLFPAV